MTLTSQKISGVGKFGLAWLVVNAAGSGLGFTLSVLFVHSAGQEGLTSLFAYLIAAGIIGIAQWLALRWLLPRMAPISQGLSWTILTMFGLIASALVGNMIANLVGPDSSAATIMIFTFITYAIAGLIIGLLQWMALLFFARGAAWWLGANALGYGLGAILRTVVQTQTNNVPLAYGLAGLLVGATTLVALSRLRRPPMS
jgi:hypothetical protein